MQAGRPRKRGWSWALAIHETVLPLLVAVLTVALFVRVDQAHEALFGTIGSVSRTLASVPKQFNPYIGPQFFALAAAIVALGMAVWYTARLLLTVDRANRHRPESNAASARAVEVFPRLIGAATSAGLIIALILAQAGRGTGQRLVALLAMLAVLLPLATMFYTIHRDLRGWRLTAAILFIAVLPWYLIIASRPGIFHFPVVSALSILCYVPALLYALLTLRRALLAKLGASPPSANASLTREQGVLRLLTMGIGGVILLFGFSKGPPEAARLFGSSAIVLLAITAILCILCAVTLVLRFLAANRPGFVLVGMMALLSVYLFLHGVFGWAPFAERTGNEWLEKAALPVGDMPVQKAAASDIVVNAHGGGLRAALFTAQVLADLDDRSCGEFGRRLQRLSGVSGGSLGIAVYMVLRQDFVANGGWGTCTPSYLNPPLLSTMVEDTLVQDHLSAALARMLSTDLLPMTRPERGQALLDSWQQATRAVLSSHVQEAGASGTQAAGLALPLRLLSGGIAPAPAVFFNSTRVSTGKQVWFTNRNFLVENGVSHPLDPGFQVGQAALHSARFPFVSPAGGFELGRDTIMLVDGGYADNSGANTLFHTDPAQGVPRWLNIDGNPPDKTCPQDDEPAQGFFSALDALLAVRESQAGLAVQRYRDKGRKDVWLKPDSEEAFKDTIQDNEERCKFVRALHHAPLGWYMTPVTVGDQSLARMDAVNKACTRLQPLCGK